jgi:hypothetical protein
MAWALARMLRGTKEEVNYRAAVVQWAQRIMRKIDDVFLKLEPIS